MTDIAIAINVLNSHDMYEEAIKLESLVTMCNCCACRAFKKKYNLPTNQCIQGTRDKAPRP